ncbi:MAG: hypothetical protein LBK65_09630 [Tannerellaceae bacterium]|jgi:hypothetical protein|nr:hypothetical protein [Tannerellaceae bacterium]
MNVLLLTAGLAFGIAGVFLCIRCPYTKYGMVCIVSGVSFLIFYLIYFILEARAEMMIQIMLIACLFVIANQSVTVKNNNRISKKQTDRRNYIPDWRFSFLFITLMLVFILPARFPSVKIENGVIRMDGAFGGVFKISDIQSVDTVSFYPKTRLMTFGSSMCGIRKGNFRLVNEQKPVKLNIRINHPPYISIRMNDSRLFLLNFKEPDETVKFYNQLRDELNRAC